MVRVYRLGQDRRQNVRERADLSRPPRELEERQKIQFRATLDQHGLSRDGPLRILGGCGKQGRHVCLSNGPGFEQPQKQPPIEKAGWFGYATLKTSWIRIPCVSRTTETTTPI